MAQRKEKIRVSKIVEQAIPKGMVAELLSEVSPRLAGMDATELAKAINLTDAQLDRLERKVAERLSCKVEEGIVNSLMDGVGVEIPRHLLLFRAESKGRKQKDGTVSEGRKNKQGKPKVRIGLSLRDHFRNQLNS